MRIAVMGAGGVGGYFGGLLARAGEDVTFIARGEHLAALQTHGLHVTSVHGDFGIVPAQATGDPASLVGDRQPPVPLDLVLFCTKTYQLDAAAAALAPALAPNTVVLPLQNGVEAPDRLAALLGPECVLGGACWVVSAVTAPGRIRQQSAFRRIVVGERDGRLSERSQVIAGLFSRAGVTAEASDCIGRVLWTKFLFIAAFSGVAAIARATAGELQRCPETLALLESAMGEVAELARAEGYPLPAPTVSDTMAFVAAMAPDATASMARDILAGRPSELAAHNGFVARRGSELGVPVPVNRYIYATLLPQELRARQISAEEFSKGI